MTAPRPSASVLSPPHLTFFCELEPEPLVKLFENPEVIDGLRALRAGVSLGLLDLSEARAGVVRRLGEAGIPVTAWLLLPCEQGYFQHVENLAESTERYEQLVEWTRRERLSWAGLGLDLELDRREIELFTAQPWRAAPVIARRAFDLERLRRGLDGYRALVARMRAEGWSVETYQFPAVADDRATGSALLQRSLGMMDLAVEREVWMLYSSLLPPRGPGWLCSYGPQAQAIAVGSTGGGIDPLPKLGWEELRRDLLLARKWSDALYVFSLEGCVAQGMLPRIAALDWAEAATIAIPGVAKRRVDRMRRGARALLRVSARVGRAADRVGEASRRALGSRA
ncbi:MAG: hypothetical protein ACOX6T_05920 [Myxococcales bacterium]|jgi:hypothetical protein